VVPSKNNTMKLQRRGGIREKGERIRRRQPPHISARILTPIVAISILMETLRKSVMKN
jgi:hypothetical protein